MSTHPKTTSHPHVAPTAKAKPVETSHPATHRNPQNPPAASNPAAVAHPVAPTVAGKPLPADPIDALRTGLNDLNAELDAMTPNEQANSSDSMQSRVGKAKERARALLAKLDEHVESLKRPAA